MSSYSEFVVASEHALFATFSLMIVGIAIEYNTNARKNCAMYSAAPERRRSSNIDPFSQCEIAATSCDGFQELQPIETTLSASPTAYPVPAQPTAARPITDSPTMAESITQVEPTEPTGPILLTSEVVLKPTPELVSDMFGFSSVTGYGRTKTTGGEGGEIVRIDNREDFIRTIKKHGPHIVLVDGMIDMRDPSCPCKTAHVISSDTTILGIGAESGLSGGGLEVRGVKFDRPPDWDPASACICDGDDEGRDDGERRFPRDITELPDDVTPTNNVR